MNFFDKSVYKIDAFLVSNISARHKCVYNFSVVEESMNMSEAL